MMGSKKQWWAFGAVATSLAAGIVAVDFFSLPAKPPAIYFKQEEREETQNRSSNQVETHEHGSHVRR